MMIEWLHLDGRWEAVFQGIGDDWIFKAYPDWDWGL
jgi:hypothetical protein